MEGTALPRSERRPAFAVGELVRHRQRRIRAVVVDVHPHVEGDDAVTETGQVRIGPWYELLLHGTRQVALVPEDDLEPDLTCLPVVHPLTRVFFHSFRQGRYVLTGVEN